MSGKTIYLVRHAKSSWKDKGLSDLERPLNKRGKRDAPRMAKRLAGKPIQPQYIISSPALRARTTAEVFAKELGMADSNVVINDDIYGAGIRKLIEIIRNGDDNFDCIMLVGHNPDLTWLVNELTGASIDNVPTCGVVTLRIASASWKDLSSMGAVLVDFDYPKKNLD